MVPNHAQHGANRTDAGCTLFTDHAASLVERPCGLSFPNSRILLALSSLSRFAFRGLTISAWIPYQQSIVRRHRLDTLGARSLFLYYPNGSKLGQRRYNIMTWHTVAAHVWVDDDDEPLPQEVTLNGDAACVAGLLFRLSVVSSQPVAPETEQASLPPPYLTLLSPHRD